jgi:hypothetical protein
MTEPLVSVIIPVGPRHSEHCKTAAASVRWQSIGRDKVETILVGDGDARIGQLPGCTVLESEGEQRGPAHARNRGIEIARGSFITFLDADDYLLPRGLEHLLRAYAEGTHGYVYGNAYTFEQDGRYELRGAPDYVQANMARYNIHVITTLIPAYQVRQVGGMDERGDAWEDWRFHLRLAIAGICGYRTNQPIFVYRVWEGDRMTRFYPNRETMQPVWDDYRNEQGVIPMAGCCGGDANLAQLAGQTANGAPAPDPIDVGEGMVRIEYVGDSFGSIPFDNPSVFGHGNVLRLGLNPRHRYANVTKEQAEWISQRAPIRIVPKSDPPMPPPDPLKAQAADETAPLAAAVKPEQDSQALRPKRAQKLG